ncbi:MAG: indole-3-glycerol-phosphate synthase [Chromatiales bacterium]|nr:indole-3-glycerol-phosphate synthase [Chromatiales bacterium]
MSPEAGDFLTRMARLSRARVEAGQARASMPALRARVADLSPPPALVVKPGGFDLIAEVKLRSPALGTLAGSALKTAAQARAYARGGALALSVLTEPEEFGGALDHLVEVAAAAAPVPVMRKDFLVDPWQVLEARASGAAGVLLIGAMLDDAVLEQMLQAALEQQMFVLLEVFDEAELQRSLRLLRRAGPSCSPDGRCRYLIGVNCRDLRTLAVDFGRFERLAVALPEDMPAVAESGVKDAADAATVAGLGYRLALVGTALMRATDPASLLAQLREAGADEADRCTSS